MNIDYFPYLNAEALLSLKAMQSYVNDTVTLRCMLNFAQRLLDDGIVTNPQYARICQSIVSKSFNSRGYDLVDAPANSGETGIVAEVKCYVPVGSNGLYGGNQKKQINSDVARLTAAQTAGSTAGYLTFLVLLDHHGTYAKAINNIMGKHPRLVNYTPAAVQSTKGQTTQNSIFVVKGNI